MREQTAETVAIVTAVGEDDIGMQLLLLLLVARAVGKDNVVVRREKRIRSGRRGDELDWGRWSQSGGR